MPQRSTAHAARRRICAYGAPLSRFSDGTAASLVTRLFDETTYDDVIPHRLRGTLVLDDDGEPAALTDLVADRVRS